MASFDYSDQSFPPSFFSTSLALVRYFPAVCSLVSPICHSPPGRSGRRTQSGVTEALRQAFNIPRFLPQTLKSRNLCLSLHSRKPYFFSKKAKMFHHQEVQAIIELMVAVQRITCQENSSLGITCRQYSVQHSEKFLKKHIWHSFSLFLLSSGNPSFFFFMTPFNFISMAVFGIWKLLAHRKVKIQEKSTFMASLK